MGAIVWLLWAACGGSSPEAALAEANEKLAASDWDGAAQAASDGLDQRGGEAGLRWSLELARLEAWARGGRSAEARQQIERLAAEYPPQVTPALYTETAAQLREAGDEAGATAVMQAGAARFPTDPSFGGGAGEGEEVPAPLGPGPEGAEAEEDAAAPPLQGETPRP